MNNELSEARKNIDQIDEEILQLFIKRMDECRKIGQFKQANALPIENPEREREILLKVWQSAGSELGNCASVLFSTLIDLSKAYQRRMDSSDSPFLRKIRESLAKTPALFPKTAKVACCGIPGAYAQVAADKLFQLADLTYFNNFSGVFQAVEKQLCNYGVLPIENSTKGTVDAVYDLMKDHHFYIVRSFRLQIKHSLLVNPGTELKDIKEIISHEQAIKQCSKFLSTLPGVKITTCSSTALAARTAAESGRKDIAAIACSDCAGIYGLVQLRNAIQNSDFNYTRFICIAKEPEIFPGSNRISIMASLPHKPGALYQMLSRFSVLGLNLTKLESRPIPGKDFEYMFYFDFAASVADPEVLKLLAELDQDDGEFIFLGNYMEE